MAREERGNLFWINVITWIANHLGRGFAQIVLYPVTFYFYATSRQTRAGSRQFLSRVLGRPPGRREVFRNHYVFASTILDRIFLYTGRMDCFDIEIHQPELILEYVSKNQGCLLVGAHLGSFEVLRAMAARNFPELSGLKILMNYQINQELADFLMAMAPEMGEMLIHTARPDTMLRVKEALDQGCLVGLLGDRIFGEEKVTSVPFLGDPVDFPLTASQLALTLKVPLFSFYGIYRGDAKYDIYFEQLCGIEEIPRSERKEWADKVTRKYVKGLEKRALDAPYNWFNFYEYWSS